MYNLNEDFSDMSEEELRDFDVLDIEEDEEDDRFNPNKDY